MSVSNIDDVLMGSLGGGETVPRELDTSPYETGPAEIEEDIPEDDAQQEEGEKETHALEEDADDTQDDAPTKNEYDDYGNEKEPENPAIRERLARQARKYEAEIQALRAQMAAQGASPQVQKAASDFEYDPDASGDWQQQLAQFVKQTVNNMSRETQQAQVRQQEAQAQQEFEGKFRAGMGKFDDFHDVMSNLEFEITDPMTIATRSMADPAAFLYAAAKRSPEELARISRIRDPYAQIAEMGRLEERMRRQKATTKAPRPLGRHADDTAMPVPKKKTEPTIEDLIARADKKRMAQLKGRTGGRR